MTPTRPAAGPLHSTIPPRIVTIAAGVGLAFLVLVVFGRAFGGGFVWDDDAHLTANPPVQSLGGLPAIWFKPGATPQYYPLVFTTFWAEFRLWGLNPGGYHVANVLLHTASALVLWRILRRLEVPGAWVAAAIWGVHPVMVESVAWITERKNTLSTLFYLLAFRSYLVYRPPGVAAAAGVPRAYWWAIAYFVAALLSKTVACTLPAALLVVAWWKSGRIAWRDVRPLLPFFILAFWFGFLTIWMERYDIGARGPAWDLGPVERVLIAGRALFFYFTTLIWPAPLAFIYPRWTVDATAAWQYAYPAAFFLVVILCWFLRSRIGRGPLAAVLLFAGTLFPALGFINVYMMQFSFVTDHFQYLASAALISLLVAMAWRATAAATPQMRAILQPAAAAIAILVLSVLTIRQIPIYENAERLWRDTLSKNPDSWMVNFNLAEHLEGQKRRTEAVPYYEAAIRAKPDHVRSLSNLAGILAASGKLDRAIDLLQRAVEAEPANAAPWQNLGAAYGRLGRFADSAQALARALEIDPTLPHARVNYAMTLIQLDRRTEAIDQIVALLERQPVFAAAIPRNSPARLTELLCEAHVRRGNMIEAIASAQAAVAAARQEGNTALVHSLESRLLELRSPSTTPADR